MELEWSALGQRCLSPLRSLLPEAAGSANPGQVKGFMTAGAQRDQVFRAVVSKLAARLDMVNLQIFRGAAILAAPIIPGENLLAESFIRLGIQA